MKINPSKLKIEELKKLIKEKVENKILFVGDENNHLYTWYDEPSEVIPSVTTVNILEKKFLIDYAVRKAFEWMDTTGSFQKVNTNNKEYYKNKMVNARKDILDDSSYIGTEVHETIDRFNKHWIKYGVQPKDITKLITKSYEGEIDTTNPAIYAGCRSYQRWADKVKETITPLSSEIYVGKKGVSAGQVDLIAYDNVSKKVIIIDHKTSNQINDDYALQVSAYRHFFCDMTDINARYTEGYVLHLDKDKDQFDLYKVKPSYDEFKRVVELYHWRNSGEDKLIKVVKATKV